MYLHQIKSVQTGEEKTLCGSHEPFSWTSSGNEAVLTYERPTADEDWEMDLEYETIEARPPKAGETGTQDCSYKSIDPSEQAYEKMCAQDFCGIHF